MVIRSVDSIGKVETQAGDRGSRAVLGRGTDGIGETQGRDRGALSFDACQTGVWALSHQRHVMHGLKIKGVPEGASNESREVQQSRTVLRDPGQPLRDGSWSDAQRGSGHLAFSELPASSRWRPAAVQPAWMLALRRSRDFRGRGAEGISSYAESGIPPPRSGGDTGDWQL